MPPKLFAFLQGEKLENDVTGKEIDENSSGDSDHDENSFEEAQESCHKPR